MIGTLLLNRYELLEKIGEGGMGIVYKAKCTLLNRFVAVKILKAELNDNETFILRFKREANSIAGLSHQNIVNIYDIGSEKNINFIVMEYINGKTLKQIIKENKKPFLKNTLDIAIQIAEALQYAHENNIIHRDIKSDNILITENNVAKLTDFGIAKVTNSKTITNSNNIIGSVHYFSPEQAKGKYVDFRTDIYALGIVMYEMFTGKLPFNGDTSISIALMHIQEPVIPPKKVSIDISENINLIILKALEKEPINRFQTAKELVYFLKAIKENPDLEVNINTNSIDDETVILTSDTLVTDVEVNPTVIMNYPSNQEEALAEKYKNPSNKNYSMIKNKKIVLAIGALMLIIGSYAVSKYPLMNSVEADEYKVPTSETKVTNDSKSEEKSQIPLDEKKTVPSLIGKSINDANSIIIANEFLLGDISYEYSDNVSSDLVINQSPNEGTLQEKNTKISLVISKGKNVTQTSSPAASQEKVNSNSSINENNNVKEKDTNNKSKDSNSNNNNNNKDNDKDKKTKNR